MNLSNMLKSETIRFSRIDVIILGAILAVASVLRFWGLSDIGIRGDEAVYAGQALIIAGEEEMERFFVLTSRGTSNFLIHQYLQSIVYAIGGFSDFTTRFLSSLFSVMTVGVVFLLGREFFGRWTGLIAAFLLAINGYHMTLGRLGLLDSTMIFFFTISMLFLAKWINSNDSKWVYLLAFTTGLAIMTKIPALIIIPISILAIVCCGKTKNLKGRTIGGFVLILILSMTPAFFQVISNYDQFVSFLFEGTSRISNVPETYYIDKLSSYSGSFFVVLTIIGVIPALVFRKSGDLFCLIWLGAVALFFQLYPLKGWNYILPLVPVASILGARAITYLLSFIKTFVRKNSKKEQKKPLKILVGIAGIILISWAAYSQADASIYNLTYDRPFVGLREASNWLADNAPPGVGVMTMSQGSAQYVVSIYSKIDSYPFGNFRLHTVLPTGEVISGPPSPDPLIQNGTVTYLIHYISYGGDDPIHIATKTQTEKKFIEFIQKYDSNIRFVFYDEYVGQDGIPVRDARLWVYEVGKRLPEPQIGINQENEMINLFGKGFLIHDFVTIYYQNNQLNKIPTDENGSFTYSFEASKTFTEGGQFVIFDDAGNRVTKSLEELPLSDKNTEKLSE